jgi:MFS family permease
MYSRKHTTACFILEGINSFGTTLYFYYIYFFTEKQFGFTKFQNLLLAAALGLTYGVASIISGRFAQRRGYFAALKAGYAIMAIAIGGGALVNALPIHLAIMFVGIFGMALTWPALEALVSEGQPRRELQRNVGIYNLVWGGLGALAYFCGGTIFKTFGFKAMFVVPAAIHVLQFIATVILERAVRRSVPALATIPGAANEIAGQQEHERLRSPVSPRTFLRMAWLANPFAYLAINTVVAVMPAVANRLQLSVAQAGVLCSIWLFFRTASFLWLWQSPGWHYRFRWLVTAYAVMTLSFIVLLLAPNLGFVIAAQIAFGLALGLIYYSSLYYSMDVGDTKGEHGGFHEAMIGLGSFAGPAIGAAGQYFFPQSQNSSTWTPAGLMVIGCLGLLWLRFGKR